MDPNDDSEIDRSPPPISPRLAFAISVSVCLTGYLIWSLLR